jgi:hypothetical protein
MGAPLTASVRRLVSSCWIHRAMVKRWLEAHARFHLHFTPTSTSRASQERIMEYLKKHNADPKPFIWSKSAGELLEKVARAKQALESQH